MILVNGAVIETISVQDRGFMYGDGVFRTLPLCGGQPLHWRRHYAKLQGDCAALGIACPPEEQLRLEVAALAESLPDGVAKIIVTRGPSARGYAPGAAALPTRIVMGSPLPRHPPRYETEGVRLFLCRTRLSLQPRLAGIKHLNRLENVLARMEWDDLGIAEGLMLDMEGNVVEGTLSNLFLVKDGTLFTPDLSRCGVAGVQRERILELAAREGIAARVQALSLAQLHEAEEVMLCNSVIGLWQVRQFQDRQWPCGELTEILRCLLHAETD